MTVPAVTNVAQLYGLAQGVEERGDFVLGATSGFSTNSVQAATNAFTVASNVPYFENHTERNDQRPFRSNWAISSNV